MGAGGDRVHCARDRPDVAAGRASLVRPAARSRRSRPQYLDPLVERARRAADGEMVERAVLLAGPGRVRAVGASRRRQPRGDADSVDGRQSGNGVQRRVPAVVRLVGARGARAGVHADRTSRRGGDCGPRVRLQPVPDRAGSAPSSADGVRHARRAVRAAPISPAARSALAVAVWRGVAAAGVVERLLPAVLPRPARLLVRVVCDARGSPRVDRHRRRLGARVAAAPAVSVEDTARFTRP